MSDWKQLMPMLLQQNVLWLLIQLSNDSSCYREKSCMPGVHFNTILSIFVLSDIPRNVSARLMDWEEMAVLKPRPSAGMMVDWQMKVST